MRQRHLTLFACLLALAVCAQTALAAPSPKLPVCHHPGNDPNQYQNLEVGNRDILKGHIQNHPYDTIGICVPGFSASAQIYEETTWGILQMPLSWEAVDLEVGWAPILGLENVYPAAWVNVDAAWDWASAVTNPAGDECAAVATTPQNLVNHLTGLNNTYTATASISEWFSNGADGNIDAQITGGTVCQIDVNADGTSVNEYTIVFAWDDTSPGQINTYPAPYDGAGSGVMHFIVDFTTSGSGATALDVTVSFVP